MLAVLALAADQDVTAQEPGAPPVVASEERSPDPLRGSGPAEPDTVRADEASGPNGTTTRDRPAEDGSTPQTAEKPPRPTDAWGAGRNGALAAGEVLLANAIPWAVNEYIRDAPFAQVNPRSWWNNIKGGWEWDDNNFSTNMFAHPFQGSLYYSAARANGFNYWASVPWAFAGSLIWECCGETHPGAINDWINTGMGGIAIGETLYRLSSTVLNNQATGTERIWREIGAAALNPVRGFTRLVTGRVGRVYENPTDPYDHLPPHVSNVLATGLRFVQDRGRLEGASTTYFFEVDFQFGGAFAVNRNKPFDFFVMGLQLNFRDKQLIGRWQIRGDLHHWDLKNTEKVQHRLVLAQNFDYINNNAYEFGGQSVSGALLSRWTLDDRWALVTLADATAQIIAGINFDGANLEQFPTQERLREYDFGPGVGGRLQFTVLRDHARVFDLSYRVTWVNTVNGAVIRTDDGTAEDSANHLVQAFYARARIPIHRNFSLGADYLAFVRDTKFDDPEFDADLHQNVGELRIFGAWSVGRGSAER